MPGYAAESSISMIMSASLATCLLPVVGFLHCSSANSQALHVVKVLHGLHVLHGNIRESNVLLTSEAEQICEVIVIDLVIHEFKALHTKVGLTTRAAADSPAVYLGLFKLNRRYLGNVTWYKNVLDLIRSLK